MNIEYNKDYYKPNILMLKNLKKRKLSINLATLINDITSSRAIDLCGNNKNEDIWNELINVQSMNQIKDWIIKFRESFDLKYDFSNEKRYGDEIRKEEGYLLSELLLNENEYFPFLEENSSNSYLNLEMKELALQKYKSVFLNVEEDKNFDEVVNKAIMLKERFGLFTIKVISTLSYSEMYLLLNELEIALEKITDAMGWDDIDFGANRLSIFIGLGVKEQTSFYDPLLNVINLPIDKLNQLPEKYAHAIDYKLGLSLKKQNKNKLFEKPEYATVQALNLLLFSENESELVKKSIKNKFTPKLRYYEKKIIKLKLIKSVPEILDSLLNKTNNVGVFKAFIENRKQEYFAFSNLYEKDGISKENLKTQWNKWKENTTKFLNSSELQNAPRINAIKYYISAMNVIIDDILEDNIKLSWFWVTVIYELEKNYFNIAQEDGQIDRNIYFKPVKSSYTELFSRSFAAFISNEINEENLFINKYEDDIRYPSGSELNYMIKWWKTHLRYFNRIWSI